MAKRIMVAVIGAGIGSLVGLLISFMMGDNNWPLILGAVAGAVVPLVVLGAPGSPRPKAPPSQT